VQVFEGILIKGGRRLTPLQRTGTVIIGLCYLLIPAVLIAGLIYSRIQKEPLFDSIDGPIIPLIMLLGAFVLAAGFAYCGLRMLKNAFTAPSKR
jgi:hypothetical protein